MNKEDFIECFFKDRKMNDRIVELSEKYDTYLSKIPFQPANLEKMETITSWNSNNDVASKLDKTLSLCSAFSRITIDQNIYKDIMKNRKDHNLFLELEEDEDVNEKNWHFMDEKENIYGPYSS